MSRALFVTLDAALNAIREVASAGVSAVADVGDAQDRCDQQDAIHRAEFREAAALIAKQVSAERCLPDAYIKEG